MWKRELGKCPGHGENQKHFVFALTEMMMMVETPFLTVTHTTWFISTSVLIISSCPWLPVFQQGWLIYSQPCAPSASALLFLTWVTLSNILIPSLLDYPQPLANPTYTSHCFCPHLADSGSPFALSLSAIPPSWTPLLSNTSLNTQYLTCHVVAKESYWKGWLHLICQLFLLSSLWFSFSLLK